MVSPLGIGGGYGIGPDALELAFERGINYFFWAPWLPTYHNMKRGLRRLIPGHRDELVIATCSYFWSVPGSLERSLNRYLKRLKTDYIDIFQLGMVRSLKHQKALETLVSLKEKGLVRYVGISVHDRRLAAKAAKDWPIDILMIRYNAAHRGAEEEIFPHIQGEGPGIVAFNTTRHAALIKRPRGWPEDRPVPSAAQCYRFVLSHPQLHLCLAGPRTKKQMDDVISAAESDPLNEEDMAFMREFGDFVHK
jgi:aryl-alcohol dehydrogenase-like predicted oxidoreductase